MGFDTDRCVAFYASLDELASALPEWRREPFVVAQNPFSVERAKVPPQLPFEHVALAAGEDWEARYLALDLALSREPGVDLDDVDPLLEERGLEQQALFGGLFGGDPRWLNLVPERLVDRLAALDDGELDAELTQWNARSHAPNSIDHLRALRSIARKSRARGVPMYMWLVHPTLR